MPSERREDERFWKELLREAEAEVGQTIEALPGPVRRHARSLPVTYERYPSQSIVNDGFDPDLLGLFVGSPLNAGVEAEDAIPSQIILFLESLWDFSEGDATVYREEVQRTYLHELGHYLGLDEDDLADRDLD